MLTLSSQHYESIQKIWHNKIRLFNEIGYRFTTGNILNFLVDLAFVALPLIADMVVAQNSSCWQVESYPIFVTVSVCSGSRICISLMCQPEELKSSIWSVDFPDEGYSVAEFSDITWAVDGVAVTFPMKGGAHQDPSDGFLGYFSYFDPDNPYVTQP